MLSAYWYGIVEWPSTKEGEYGTDLCAGRFYNGRGLRRIIHTLAVSLGGTMNCAVCHKVLPKRHRIVVPPLLLAGLYAPAGFIGFLRVHAKECEAKALADVEQVLNGQHDGKLA